VDLAALVSLWSSSQLALQQLLADMERLSQQFRARQMEVTREDLLDTRAGARCLPCALACLCCRALAARPPVLLLLVGGDEPSRAGLLRCELLRCKLLRCARAPWRPAPAPWRPDPPPHPPHPAGKVLPGLKKEQLGAKIARLEETCAGVVNVWRTRHQKKPEGAEQQQQPQQQQFQPQQPQQQQQQQPGRPPAGKPRPPGPGSAVKPKAEVKQEGGALVTSPAAAPTPFSSAAQQANGLGHPQQPGEPGPGPGSGRRTGSQGGGGSALFLGLLGLQATGQEERDKALALLAACLSSSTPVDPFQAAQELEQAALDRCACVGGCLPACCCCCCAWRA
jgi:hypothetical protein